MGHGPAEGVELVRMVECPDDIDVTAGVSLPGCRRRRGEPLRAGDEATVHSVTRAQPGGAVVETTRDVIDGVVAGGADWPRPVAVGPGASPPGLGLALEGMRVGQRSVFRVPRSLVVPPATLVPPWTSGSIAAVPVGLERRPAGEWFELDVEVVGGVAMGAAPGLFTPAEVARMRAEREERERAQFFRDGGGRTWEARLREARGHREAAALLRRAGDARGAVESVGRGFARLVYTSEEAKHRPATAAEEEAVVAERRLLHGERARCRLLVGEHDEAAWDARGSGSRSLLAEVRLSFLSRALDLGPPSAAADAPAAHTEPAASLADPARPGRAGAAFDPELGVVVLLLACRDLAGDRSLDGVAASLQDALDWHPPPARPAGDELGRPLDDPYALARLQRAKEALVGVGAPAAARELFRHPVMTILARLEGLLRRGEAQRRARFRGALLPGRPQAARDAAAPTAAKDAAAADPAEDATLDDLPPLEECE